MPGMSVGAYNPYVYSPNVGLGQPTPALDAGTGLAGTSLYKPTQPPGYPGAGGGFDLGGNGNPMQMIVQMLQLMMMMFQMFLGGGRGLPLPLGNAGTAGGNAGTAGTGLAGTGLAGTGLAGTGLAGTGLAGTGIAGTNNGVAGTNFGIAGTNNGVAGTNFGIAGNNIGGGGNNVGGGGNNGVAGTNNGVAGTNYGYGNYTPPAQDNTPVYTPPVYTPPAQDNTPVYTPPVYTPPPAQDNTPVYTPPVEQPPANDNTPPVMPYCPPVEPPPAKDTEPPVYPPPPVEPPPPVYPPPPPPPDYKDNDKGNYWGDPHFVGFGGEKYDVMGTAGQTYNILSDKGLQYNAKFEQWGKGDATVIGEAGMLVGNDKVHFDRSGAAPTVNGVAMEVGKEVQLDNGSGSAVWDGTKLVVNTREYTIDLQVKDPNNANGAYIDSNVSIRSGVNPLADGVAAHGILGQTADGTAGAHVGNLGQDQGKQGGTVIDGTVADYVINGGIFSTNGANAQFIRYA